MPFSGLLTVRTKRRRQRVESGVKLKCARAKRPASAKVEDHAGEIGFYSLEIM